MSQMESYSAMNGRAKQHDRKRSRASLFCGCMPLFRRFRIHHNHNSPPSNPNDIPGTVAHRLSIEPGQSPRTTSLLSGVRTQSVRKSSVTVPSEMDPAPAHGVVAMYRGAAGGNVKVPRSAFWGKHENWRRQISGQDDPVQGRFRKAYPEYDEDP